jgi:hypothetical protein
VTPRRHPMWVSRDPPSGSRARVWTLLSAFWMWFFLPVAIHYQRKARREADASGGFYVWPKSLWNRPVVLFLIVLLVSVGLVVAMAAVGMYGDQARYTGRVASIQGNQLCLGPNTSGPSGTCGTIPPRAEGLPAVGNCVSLTADHSDGGRRRTWHRGGLHAIADAHCR